jgi:hypothetical protein
MCVICKPWKINKILLELFYCVKLLVEFTNRKKGNFLSLKIVFYKNIKFTIGVYLIPRLYMVLLKKSLKISYFSIFNCMNLKNNKKPNSKYGRRKRRIKKSIKLIIKKVRLFLILWQIVQYLNIGIPVS